MMLPSQKAVNNPPRYNLKMFQEEGKYKVAAHKEKKKRSNFSLFFPPIDETKDSQSDLFASLST